MKKLTINPLDHASIDRAIKYLEKYDKLVEKAADAYTGELERIGRDVAEATYRSSSTTVEMGKTDKGHHIVASGSQVVFLEFGTGIYAGLYTQDSDLGDSLDIEISPGSWSRSPEGKGTYDRWEREHEGDMSEYPWNMEPRMGMHEAYKAIRRSAKDAAKVSERVFDDD